MGVLSGELVDVTVYQGLMMIAGALPIVIVGLVSAIGQGKAAVAGIHLVGKRSDQSGKAITFAVMVETYAVLALLMSFLIVFFVPLG